MESEVFGTGSSVVVVAHELKAPLALMRQLALSIELENDLAGAQKVSEQIVATSERALRQVNDLTKVARLEDAMFEMEPVNPRVVCDEVLAELWKYFRFNRRELSIEYKNKRKLVVGNRQLLFSVVYNFCLNAMNYGGEELPSRVIVRDLQGNKVRVEVRDYGPAVPTKIWRQIKDGVVKQPVDIAMRPGSSGRTSFYIDLPVSGQLSFL